MADFEEVVLKDGRVVRAPKSIVDQAVRIADAQNVSATDVFTRLMQNAPREKTAGGIAGDVVTDTLTNIGDAAKAAGPGALNFLRGQGRAALRGENLPGNLPFIPVLDDKSAFGFRMDNPLNLARQGAARALGVRDLVGEADTNLAQQIDKSNQQFESTDPTFVERVGRLSPEIAAMLALRNPKSIANLPFVRQSTALGAIAGGLTPRGENDGLVENAAIGGAGGFAFGGGLKTLGFGKDLISAAVSRSGRDAFIAKRLVDATKAGGKFDTPAAKAQKKLFKLAGIDDPTLSGLSGSSRLSVSESAAKTFDPDAAKISEDILKQNMKKGLTRIVNKFDPDKTSDAQAARLIFKTVKKGVDNLDKVRKSIFNKGFSAAKRATGDQKVIDAKEVVAALDGKISSLKNAAKGKQEVADLKDLVAFRKEMVKFKKMSVSDLQNLLSSQGKQAAGKDQIIADFQTEASRRTKAFVFGELKNLLRNVAKDNKAVLAFSKARDAYGRISDRIKAFKNTDLGKAVDTKFKDFNQEKTLKAALKADPEELRAMVPMLKRFNPKAYGALVRQHYKDLASKSRPDVTSPGKSGNIDPDKLIKKMLSDENKKKFFAIFGKKDRRDILTFARAYRDVINRAKGNDSFVSEGRDVGGFLAPLVPKFEGLNQLPVFLFRFLAKGITEGALARLMLTKAGRQAVINASRAKPGSPTFNKAIAVLAKEAGIKTKQKLRENNGN